MTKIFIGYRRDDGGHARALYENLCYWFDAEKVFLDHENLDPGAKFTPVLEEAVAGCTVFLAVIGQHWLSDENRKRLHREDDITCGEIRSAIGHDKILIPVLAGGAAFPPEAALPEDIRAMQAANAHHQLEAQYQASFIKLLEALKNYGLPSAFRRRDGSPQPFHLIDLPLSKNFVDPAGHLPELHQALHDQGAAALIAATTVHGMGGVGKTQLALAYSHAYRAEYAGVWWFRAEDPALLELDCQGFCTAQGFVPREGELPRQAVKRWLQAQPPWLLVYDNAENKHQLADFLPTCGGHHLLISSRDRNWDEIARPLALDVWTEDQALEFLGRRLPATDQAEQRRLAVTLGGLPLALEQACAYILKHGVGIDLYCREVENWQRANPLLDRTDAVGYPYSVLTTLSLAFDRLSVPARELLRLAAWFAPESLPERLFHELADLLPEALQAVTDDELGWRECVAELESHALVQPDQIPALDRKPGETRTEPAFSLHRLTQEAIRARLADRAVDCAAVVTLLQRAYPTDPEHPDHWPTYAALLPHVQLLQDFYPHGWVDGRSLSLLLSISARYLQCGPALYAVAEGLFGVVLEICREDLAEAHPDTLATMDNLSLTMLAQGKLAAARALQEEVLTICRRDLGAEHPDTLNSMDNLATTMLDQGELAAASALGVEVLTIRHRTLGAEHPYTLTSMNNLAATLSAQGKLATARALQEEVLEARRRVLGAEYPDTLTSMGNLAATMLEQDELAAARALQEEMLTICRRVLGAEHPYTLTSMHNLAENMRAQGELDSALALQEQVLTIRRQVLGAEHPDTLASMVSLAMTMRVQGGLAAARALLEEVLIRCRVLGAEHPKISIAAFNLFVILLESEELDEVTMAAIFQEHLAWLLGRDPANLGAVHCGIQGQLFEIFRH